MRVTTLLLLSGLSAPLAAQTAADSALAVVTRLFAAMHAKDSTAIMATFDTSATLRGYTQRGGHEMVTRTRAAEFARIIANIPADRAIEEVTWDAEVRVDDYLATVWTPYVFLVNGIVSHCGQDAVLLMRFSTGWKIVAIADTRRTEGCEAPKR